MQITLFKNSILTDRISITVVGRVVGTAGTGGAGGSAGANGTGSTGGGWNAILKTSDISLHTVYFILSVP